MYHVHTWHHLVYQCNGDKKFGKRRSSSVAGIFSPALDFFSHSQFFSMHLVTLVLSVFGFKPASRLTCAS